MVVLQSLISLWKRKGKEEKKLLHGVTQPSTNVVKQGLTSLSEPNMLLSLWYRDYAACLFLIS